MSSRCTPFGLFAGCSLGTLGKGTSIELDNISTYQRQTRFDMHFLVALSQQLAKREDIKNQILWYPNTSLYKIGNQYRYVEYTYTKHNRREHAIEAVTVTPYLQKVIERANHGATMDLLAGLLVDEEITKVEAADFIHQLIDNQILVSTLEPSICGADFLTQIIDLLKGLEYVENDENLLSDFKRFANAFTKRYETREIPLTTVLDTEIGIGYLQDQQASDSTPFLDGLEVPFIKNNQQNLNWDSIQEILAKKLQSVQNTKALVMELRDSDFEQLDEYWGNLPDTISGMAELVKIEGEEKMILSSVGGLSATNLLGRFTLGDSVLKQYVQEITSLEQQMNPEYILAEIIHLPESRIGNVIQRASLRDYEISYLGKSNLPREQQIPIDDLMISVRNGKVQLRSKRLNKYILPKLSNAHNYSANALPIYHLLCDLQKQGLRSSLGFYWGNVLEREQFLPRVIYKDFILSKAKWMIKKEDITELITNKKEELIAAVKAWRASLHIPKLVQLVDGDNTLLINLENYDMIRMWLDMVKKRKSFVLEEFLFTEECVVKRGNEGFTNQFVISFYNEEKLKKARKLSSHT